MIDVIYQRSIKNRDIEKRKKKLRCWKAIWNLECPQYKSCDLYSTCKWM